MRRALLVFLAVLVGCRSESTDRAVAPVIASFSATPSTVAAGVATEVTWTWSYENAPTPEPACSIDGGVGVVANGGTTTLTLSADAEFVLTCTNSRGSATASATVSAAAKVAPQVASFAASPSTVVAGAPTVVTFTFEYANTPWPAPSCTVAPDVGPVVSGTSAMLTLGNDAVYSLTCTNDAGADSAEVTIPVMIAPVLAGFAATPSSVIVDTPTDVTWSWTYTNAPTPAPTCTIDHAVGTVTSGTTTSVNLSADTVFTITCSNGAGEDGAQVTVSAKAPPVIGTFSASPASVPSAVGTSVTFSWTYVGTPSPSPSCTIDHEIGSVTSGETRILNIVSDTTYTLTCTSSAGTDTAQVTVAITPPRAPVIATFTASPSIVKSGNSTYVVWTWTYESPPSPTPMCQIDHGIGYLSSGSSSMIALTAETTYTLTCTNTAGSDTAQVTFTIAVPPVVDSFTASPSLLGVDASTGVTWTFSISNTPVPEATCSIDGGVGAVVSGATTSVTLSRARIYRLTCSNVGGRVTADVTLSVDECAGHVDDCGPHAHCVDTVESFYCACDAGYAGDGNVCSALVACDTTPSLCHANATCTTTGGGPACVCADGYAGDGLTCERLRLAFVTSVTGLGDLSQWADAGGNTGIAAGDAVCQARAVAAGLPGTYVAWLSDSTSDAYCRVHGRTGKKSANCGLPSLPVAAGPWVRTDLLPFAPAIDRMLAPTRQAFYPAGMDEFGVAVAGVEDVFTGTATTGTWRGWPPTNNAPCRDWTSVSSSDFVAHGVAFGGGVVWTDHDVFGNRCNVVGRLRCLEIGSGPPLPPRHSTARKAFVTSVQGNGNLSTWTDAGGLAGIEAADAVCRARARSAGLANAERFKALMSRDSTSTAAGRITSNGPWVRVDGMLVASDKADLFDRSIHAPIAVSESGAYLDENALVWVGSTWSGGAHSWDCLDWGSAGDFGRVGQSDVSTAWFGEDYASSCNAMRRLFCFED